MQITSNIYVVGGGGLSSPEDAAVYLVKSGNSAALVDSGTGIATQEILSNIRNTNTNPEQIEYIFLTHCHFDHTGGAAKLREHSGAHIVMHDLDAVYVETGDSEVTAAAWYGTFMKPFLVDVKVGQKKTGFRVGELEVFFIHTPGHSPGSAILTVESDNKLVLFGQDVHGPLNESLRSSRNDYNASLEFMLSLQADILCEGHFGIITGKDKVNAFIDSFL